MRKKHLLIIHAKLCNGAISQIFYLNFYLFPYFEYVSSIGSDETVCLRRLDRALAARLRDK